MNLRILFYTALSLTLFIGGCKKKDNGTPETRNYMQFHGEYGYISGHLYPYATRVDTTRKLVEFDFNAAHDTVTFKGQELSLKSPGFYQPAHPDMACSLTITDDSAYYSGSFIISLGFCDTTVKFYRAR